MPWFSIITTDMSSLVCRFLLLMFFFIQEIKIKFAYNFAFRAITRNHLTKYLCFLKGVPKGETEKSEECNQSKCAVMQKKKKNENISVDIKNDRCCWFSFWFLIWSLIEPIFFVSIQPEADILSTQYNQKVGSKNVSSFLKIK